MDTIETAVVAIKPELNDAVIKLRDEAARLVVYAESFTVANPNDVKRATKDLSMIANLKKALETKRKEYTEPLNTHLKDINEAFKAISVPVGVADQTLRDKVLAYNKEQQRLKAEADKAEALREQAAKIEAKLTQETGEIFEHPAPAPMPEAKPMVKAYTDVGNMRTRKIRKWKEVDFSKVPDAYKMLDSAKINKVVKAGIPETREIDIYEEDTLTITAKKGE